MPTPEEALAIKPPGLPPSAAALRITAEPATPKKAEEITESAAILPVVPRGEVAPISAAVSPTAAQAANLTPSPDPPPAQPRPPAAEIAALIARGDALFFWAILPPHGSITSVLQTLEMAERRYGLETPLIRFFSISPASVCAATWP